MFQSSTTKKCNDYEILCSQNFCDESTYFVNIIKIVSSYVTLLWNVERSNYKKKCSRCYKKKYPTTVILGAPKSFIFILFYFN